MTMSDRLKYLYIFFWAFFIAVNGNNIQSDEDSKMMLVFFRWSTRSEQNAEEIRCAIDESSENSSNIFLETYTKLQGL